MSKRSKNKPAIIITRFPYESAWGGEESHTLTLAKYLIKEGYEVILFTSCPILIERGNEIGCVVHKVWGGRMIVTLFELVKSFILFPFIIWNLKKHFKAICKKHDVKALYCLSLNEKIFLTPVALKRRIPVTWVEHQEIRKWLTANPWRKRYQKLAKEVMIVPISKKNERILKRRLQVHEASIKFIINGVDTNEISLLKRRTKKGLIVAANRMIPKKGLMDFLVALKHLDSYKDQMDIRMLGEGSEERDLKEFIEINLKGYNIEMSHFLKKENWHKLLTRADIYVSCARDHNETFSLNTAEALAAGCKVVVSKSSGIADFIMDDREAFLCNPKDPADLAEHIRLALTAPNEMRKEAKDAANIRFNQKRMLEEYEQLILRPTDDENSFSV